jgi:hypothetical protein
MIYERNRGSMRALREKRINKFENLFSHEQLHQLQSKSQLAAF